MPDAPGHSRDPQLIALLFCREVIVESDGSVSPFRLIESADISVFDPQAIWQKVDFHLFVGVACYGLESRHEHELEITVYYPDGQVVIGHKMAAVINKPLSTAYANLGLRFPGSVAGNYSIVVLLDGKLVGNTFFAVTHVEIAAQAPEQAKTVR